jgi:hypothetical protein
MYERMNDPVQRELLDSDDILQETDDYYRGGGVEGRAPDPNIPPLTDNIDAFVDGAKGTGNTVELGFPVKLPRRLKPDSETGINNRKP